MTSPLGICRYCSRQVSVRQSGILRTHRPRWDQESQRRCEGSGTWPVGTCEYDLDVLADDIYRLLRQSHDMSDSLCAQDVRAALPVFVAELRRRQALKNPARG